MILSTSATLKLKSGQTIEIETGRHKAEGRMTVYSYHQVATVVTMAEDELDALSGLLKRCHYDC